MKKLTTILTALILLVSATAFSAKTEVVSDKVRSAFEKAFANASNVNWKKLNEYYLADFTVNDQNALAAFDEARELVSAARSITLNQIPLIVGVKLQSSYPGYTFAKAVTELTADGITNYFIKGENAKRIVTIRVNSFGDLTLEHKIRKKQ